MKASTPNRIVSAALALMLAATLAILTGCEPPASVSGEQGQTLTLIAPSPVTITQAELVPVKIKIDRGTIKEPIAVFFDDLPKGVTVVDEHQKIIGVEGTYVLQAAGDADLVAGHHAKVTAKGPRGIAVTQDLVLTVKEKKAP